MSEDLEATIRKYALQNAVLYSGKANPKAVQGKVLAESPELRSRVKEVLPLIASIVEEVNSLAPEVQHKQLEDIDASMLKREKTERRVGLPELPGMEKGKVVMRFAPGRPDRCTSVTPASPSSTMTTAGTTTASSSTAWRTPTRTR